jgi:hypothetical protein
MGPKPGRRGWNPATNRLNCSNMPLISVSEAFASCVSFKSPNIRIWLACSSKYRYTSKNNGMTSQEISMEGGKII